MESLPLCRWRERESLFEAVMAEHRPPSVCGQQSGAEQSRSGRSAPCVLRAPECRAEWEGTAGWQPRMRI